MKYVSVLTPPLLVCAVFLIGVVAFLRHEMGRKRARSEDLPASDISDSDAISGLDADSPRQQAGPAERTDDN